MCNDEKIFNEIIEALDVIGIIVDENICESTELSEVIPDSLSFVTFIVEIEERFGIEIDDEYLSADVWSTFEKAKNIILTKLNDNRTENIV